MTPNGSQWAVKVPADSLRSYDLRVAAAKTHFERYVALGDSSAEGLDDPDGRGGYRGWADRLAERITSQQGSLQYANLAVRGRRTHQIRVEQLEAATTLRPSLATLFAGTNDVVSRRFDLAQVAGDLEAMQTALIEGGATLLTFTLPELGPVLPLANRLAPRIESLNSAIRDICQRTGALLVDFAAYPVCVDPRLWSDDRLHANALGHERIAHALAHALGLPGADASWQSLLPPQPQPTWHQRVAAEVSWVKRHLVPWLWRHALGKSTGDRRQPKRPQLTPL